MRSIVYLLLFVTTVTFAQSNVKAFKAGENLTFTASYNMSGLMTDLAQVTMQTSEIKTSKSTLLKLKCTARTYSKWDSFFKIRDLYESYVNPITLTPYLYKRDIDEGGYYKFVKYIFNHKTKTVKSLRRQKSKNFESGFWDRNSTVKINSGTKDLVTTIYHIRNLDINKASIGSSDTFTVLFDNDETKITITLLAKETVKTKLGNKECYKLGISVNNSDLFKGNNNNLLWLTADENKIPVYAKFKVAIGSGELRIQSATGLKTNYIMKLLFSILGLLSSILAVILAILPMEKIALIPAIAAFVFALIAMYLSKNESKKLVKFVFFVTIIALAIITYKSVFSGESEITSDENFIEKNQESEEKAIEELEELQELDTFEESDSIN